MNALLRSLVISLIIVFVTACGGGTTTNTDIPTDTSLVFSSFPPGYFGGSYSASYSLTGSDTNGGTYTSTYSIQSGTDTTFNSQDVKTINELILLTNTSTNVVAGTLSNDYYTTDINNLKYVGYYTDSNGVSAMPSTPTSNSVLPLTGSIGDFGEVGSYTRSDGSNFSKSWSLVDGYNGKAKLVITTTSNDTSNILYFTTVEKRLISQDGTISGIEVIITYHQSGNRTVTLTGS